jgi:hypothetical protein
MKNNIARATLFACLLLLAAPCPASARDRGFDSPFWWAFDLGYGSVGISHDDRSSDYQDAFYMSFKGGLKLDESLRIGVEVGGWTLEAEDTWDPDRGEGISQTGIVVLLAPPDTPFQLSGSFDYLDYWNNDYYADFQGQGWSATLGFGYTFVTDLGLELTPAVSYTIGRVHDDSYYDSQSRDIDVLTLKIGLSYNAAGHPRYQGW